MSEKCTFSAALAACHLANCCCQCRSLWPSSPKIGKMMMQMAVVPVGPSKVACAALRQRCTARSALSAARPNRRQKPPRISSRWPGCTDLKTPRAADVKAGSDFNLERSSERSPATDSSSLRGSGCSCARFVASGGSRSGGTTQRCRSFCQHCRVAASSINAAEVTTVFLSPGYSMSTSFRPTPARKQRAVRGLCRPSTSPYRIPRQPSSC
mmetsp:Transcript_49853/g.79523  ORF Transcript_49853/g.79523 Transcript_49853/m.79523 type:complete len:211 (-) Transcript_49853:300-932(-)